MRNLLLLLSVIVGLSLSACEKDDPKDQINETPNPVAPTQFFISGTYYEEYGDTKGIANAEIVLETEDDFGVPVIVGLDTTDENGCFRIDYEKLDRSELTLFVRWIGPNSITNPLNGFRYQCLPGDTTFDALRLFDGIHEIDINMLITYSDAFYLDTLFLPKAVSKDLDSLEMNFGIQERKVYYKVLNSSGVYAANFNFYINSNFCAPFITVGRAFLGRETLLKFTLNDNPDPNKYFEIKYAARFPVNSINLNYSINN